MLNEPLLSAINEHFGLTLLINKVKPIGGGDSSQCFQVTDSANTRYFIKLNHNPEPLEAEMRNLNLLRNTPITTPKFLGFSVINNLGVLLLEHLVLTDNGDEASLGRQLAELHKVVNDRYGLAYNNFIGPTPQRNDWHNGWAGFWWQCRLAPQFAQAESLGYRLGIDATQLQALSDGLLQGHKPAASLLHGDLWGGNKGYLADATPVLFDPASYYGDRETDLAFTLVFGGFGDNFYHSYQRAWPLPPGWQKRESLYNLYHFLNHLNLFGSAYLGSVKSVIKSLRNSSTGS